MEPSDCYSLSIILCCEITQLRTIAKKAHIFINKHKGLKQHDNNKIIVRMKVFLLKCKVSILTKNICAMGKHRRHCVALVCVNTLYIA